MQKISNLLVINKLYFLHLYISVHLLNRFLWTHQTTNEKNLAMTYAFLVPCLLFKSDCYAKFIWHDFVSFFSLYVKIEMLLNCRKSDIPCIILLRTPCPLSIIEKRISQCLFWFRVFYLFVLSFFLEL